MRKLDRYVAASFLRSFFLVIFILLSLFSFIELVAQLDDVGKGQYELTDAFVVVALTTPRRIVDLISLSTLLGSIIGLGLLADRGELLAMRAAGISGKRICASVLGAVALLVVGAGLLGESVAPPWEQRARTLRSQAFAGPGMLITKHGFWARRGDSFIHVGEAFQGGRAADLDVYERDEEGRLTMFAHAREAVIDADKAWLLRDIEQKIISSEGIKTRHLPSLAMRSFLSSQQVAILELPPDSLSVLELYEYILALRDRGQNVDRYILVLWQKMAMPLTTCAMVLLSLPFVFGSLRVRTAGFRIMVGSIAGVLFYIGNQIAGHFGLVYGLHPAVTTLTPVAAILAVAFVLWRRVR